MSATHCTVERPTARTRNELGQMNGTPLPPFSRADLYWLAGLLEGEGCFSFTSRKRPQVVLAMTDEDVVARVAAMWGRNYRVRSAPSDRNRNAKPLYAVAVTGWVAVELCRRLKPFMGQRRQARIQELIAA